MRTSAHLGSGFGCHGGGRGCRSVAVMRRPATAGLFRRHVNQLEFARCHHAQFVDVRRECRKQVPDCCVRWFTHVRKTDVEKTSSRDVKSSEQAAAPDNQKGPPVGRPFVRPAVVKPCRRRSHMARAAVVSGDALRYLQRPRDPQWLPRQLRNPTRHWTTSFPLLSLSRMWHDDSRFVRVLDTESAKR